MRNLAVVLVVGVVLCLWGANPLETKGFVAKDDLAKAVVFFQESSENLDQNISLMEFLKLLVVSTGFELNPSEGNEERYFYQDVPLSMLPYVEEATRRGLVTFDKERPFLGAGAEVSVVQALELSRRAFGIRKARSVNDEKQFEKVVRNYKSSFILAPLIEQGLSWGILESRDGRVEVFNPITKSEVLVLLYKLMLDPPEKNEVPQWSSPSNATGQWEILEDVYKRISKDYFNGSNAWAKPDLAEIVYGAIAGMVEKLGDPYSVFLKPENRQEFQNELNNSVEGIGVSLTLDEQKRIMIVSPLPGSPAFKAGLKPGDIITLVDGVATFKMNLNEVALKIKGPTGTRVNLTVERGGQSLTFEIIRDKVSVPNVSGEITLEGVGVITVRNFGLGVENSFKNYVKQMKEARVKGIVLDLRNNPGGYLNAAVSLASNFVQNGEVVAQVRYNSNRVDYHRSYLSAESSFLRVPLVVLVNKGSASASEILAAALKEKAKAKIVGEKTFGKGTVQDLISYQDNSALKLTIGEWLTANGLRVNKTGLTPDYYIINSEADLRLNNDAQLKKALSLIVAGGW